MIVGAGQSDPGGAGLVGICGLGAGGGLRIRPVSWTHMAISTRGRASSSRMRLAGWVLTVLMLMYNSSAVSLLVRPRTTGMRKGGVMVERDQWVGVDLRWR